MTATTDHARRAGSDPQCRRTEYVHLNRRTEYVHLKKRLDAAQLELTIAALRATLPESSAREAAETLRRMHARAQRWEH